MDVTDLDQQDDRDELENQLVTLEATLDEAVDEGANDAYIASLQRQIVELRRELSRQ